VKKIALNSKYRSHILVSFGIHVYVELRSSYCPVSILKWRRLLQLSKQVEGVALGTNKILFGSEVGTQSGTQLERPSSAEDGGALTLLVGSHLLKVSLRISRLSYLHFA
jgi:hypothetical protein